MYRNTPHEDALCIASPDLSEKSSSHGNRKLKTSLNTACIALVSLALVACSSAPNKVSLSPETKQSIKRIALINQPEPSQYAMNPGQITGGSALYLFGALGGAVLGSIHVARMQAATTKFTAAVLPHKPDISVTMLDQLEAELKKKGYEVTRVSAPPQTADGKGYDLAKIDGAFDAVLAESLSGGYSANSGSATPRVVASITLIEKSSNHTLFTETYTYGSEMLGESVPITPDSKYTFSSVDDVYADSRLAAEALKTGATKLAVRIAQDL